MRGILSENVQDNISVTFLKAQKILMTDYECVGDCCRSGKESINKKIASGKMQT